MGREVRWKIVLSDLLTGGLKKAAGEVGRFGRIVSLTAKGIRSAFGGISRAVFSLKGMLVGGLGAAGALRGLGAAVKQAFRVETVQTQFSVLLKSAERAKRMLADLKKFSASTPFEFDAVASSGKTLLGFGVAAEDIVDTLTRLGNIAAGTGADLGSLAVVYGQIRSAGKLMGQDLMQLINNNVPMLGALSEEMYGVEDRTTDVRKAIERGEVSFQTFDRALTRMTTNGGMFDQMLAKLSKTGGGMISALKGEWLGALADFGAAFVGLAKDGIQTLLDKIRKLRTDGTITKWAEAVAEKVRLVKDTLLSIGGGDTKAIKLSIDVLKAGVHDAFLGAVDLLLGAAPRIGKLIGVAAKTIMTMSPPTSVELFDSAKELGLTDRPDWMRRVVGYGGAFGMGLNPDNSDDAAVLAHARRKRFKAGYAEAGIGLLDEKPEPPAGRYWLPGALSSLRAHVTPKAAAPEPEFVGPPAPTDEDKRKARIAARIAALREKISAAESAPWPSPGRDGFMKLWEQRVDILREAADAERELRKLLASLRPPPAPVDEDKAKKTADAKAAFEETKRNIAFDNADDSGKLGMLAKEMADARNAGLAAGKKGDMEEYYRQAKIYAQKADQARSITKKDDKGKDDEPQKKSKESTGSYIGDLTKAMAFGTAPGMDGLAHSRMANRFRSRLLPSGLKGAGGLQGAHVIKSKSEELLAKIERHMAVQRAIIEQQLGGG